MRTTALDRYLNAAEVGELLNISRSAAYRLIQQCEHIRTGRITRVSERALQAFLKRRTSDEVHVHAGRDAHQPGSKIRLVYPRTRPLQAVSPSIPNQVTSEPVEKKVRTKPSQDDTDAVLAMLKRWQIARDLRDFAHEIRSTLTSAELQMTKGGELEQFVRSLLERADAMDPLRDVRRDVDKMGLGQLRQAKLS
jgi:hypothetical protein